VGELGEQMVFRFTTASGGEGEVDYSGDYKKYCLMRNYIIDFVPDTKFISTSAGSDYGKLLFRNGIYNFTTGQFTAQFDAKCVFLHRIDWDFPTTREEARIKEVGDMLFVNAFSEQHKEAGVFVKKVLTVGLLGDYRRKKFYFMLGDTNCGKGLTTYAMTKTFGGYVAEWVPDNLKENHRNGQDTARKLGWTIKFSSSRIALSNEIGMDVRAIDGITINTLSSGGDTFTARGHMMADRDFVNRAAMIVFANDLPQIKPLTTAVKDRLRFIRYTKTFVMKAPNELLPNEMIADPLAKDKFNTLQYKEALFWNFVDCYNAMTEDERKLGGQLYEPECVKEETTEWVAGGDDASFENTILERFVITGNPEDAIESKMIVDYILNDKRMRMSPVEVGRKLTAIIARRNPECPKDRTGLASRGEQRGKKYRLGIRLAVGDEEEE
jgi:hypothetical protein